MDGPQAITVPGQFVRQVRDVLAHFYDYAYLLSHPLLAELTPAGASEAATVTQELRRSVLDALEELRPPPGTPADDPSWRPYRVIHTRYILGKEPDEVEQELALGKRQVQREQQRGLSALARTLWSKRSAAASDADERSPVSTSPLKQEISRLAARAEWVALPQLIANAAAATGSLASLHEVRLQIADGPAERALGDPSLLRQLAVAAMSFAIRAMPHADIEAATCRVDGVVALQLRAAPGAVPVPEQAIPEALTALAEAQQAEVACGMLDGQWCLEIRLPVGQDEQTVAIVEDNDDVIALFSRYLEGHYRLVAVRDSANVLQRLAELAPDAILLDVMMRNVDGWEILQRLKADPELRDIPVVVCSVLDEPELARCIGAQAYLRKPVRPLQLLDCLASLMQPGRSEAVAPSSAD